MRVIINPIRVDDYQRESVARTQLRNSVNLDDHRLAGFARGLVGYCEGIEESATSCQGPTDQAQC
jgi:hypothetical protein